MSKNISSNSLFHFTSRLDYLKDILKNGFWPRYCREYGWSNKYIDFALPMVCFCDIPLSQISEHVGFYGKYGIGVRADWIRQHKTITPVHYLAANSYHFDNINKLLTKLKNRKISKEEGNVLSLAKKVSGRVVDKNGAYRNIKFYDEREWRHIPDEIPLDKLLIPIEKKQPFDSNAISDETKNLKLKIDIESIKYVLVPSEAERSKIIKIIQDIFSKEPVDSVNRLLSRILSIDQIANDF